MRDILSEVKLADMAAINKQRRSQICKLFVITTMTILGAYSCVNFFFSNLTTASFNAIGAFLCLVNLSIMSSSEDQSDNTVLLTIALIIHAIINLVPFTGNVSHIFWIFPLIAATIYVNKFRISLGISIAYCLLAAIILMKGNSWGDINFANLSQDRLFIALVVTCTVCLISNYYCSKSLNYIQTLYQSGIEELAYKDRLTGLANRWTFETWAKKTLEEARYSGDITALVFLDIDNFKQINDNFGHDMGDQLLQHFSKRLENSIRKVNRQTHEHEFSIARYAGDEFMILLHDIPDKSTLENIVRRINLLFSDDYEQESKTGKLTFSIGISIYQKDADTLEDLIRCADKAMYQAKKTGKNQYTFFESEPERGVSEDCPPKKAPYLQLV